MVWIFAIGIFCVIVGVLRSRWIMLAFRLQQVEERLSKLETGIATGGSATPGARDATPAAESPPDAPQASPATPPPDEDMPVVPPPVPPQRRRPRAAPSVNMIYVSRGFQRRRPRAARKSSRALRPAGEGHRRP